MDPWAIESAPAEAQAAFNPAEACDRDALGAPPGKLAIAPPTAVGVAGPLGVDLARASSARGPLKELHFEEVMTPARYTGSVANWIKWSRRFRDFSVARTDERLDELLMCIEQLRGRLVTAEDKATWEAKLDLTPSIEPGTRGSTCSWTHAREALQR